VPESEPGPVRVQVTGSPLLTTVALKVVGPVTAPPPGEMLIDVGGALLLLHPPRNARPTTQHDAASQVRIRLSGGVV
jgi:hypothetical protein